MQDVKVFSLGGMSWVRNICDEWKVVGPKGPFDEATTIPQVLQHTFLDDFNELLTAGHFYTCSRSNRGAVRHLYYERMILDTLQPAFQLDRLKMMMPKMKARSVLPPMFKHPGEYGITGLVEALPRRVQRLRDFLCEDSWKVMVWGVAIPYWAIKRLLEENTSLYDLVEKPIMNLFEALKASTSIKRFALAVVVIVDGVPEGVSVGSRSEVLSDYTDAQQACVFHYAWFRSTRCGAHFVDKGVDKGTAQREKDEVKAWFLEVRGQEGWRPYPYRCNNTIYRYYANKNLRFHQWTPPADCLVEEEAFEELLHQMPAP